MHVVVPKPLHTFGRHALMTGMVGAARRPAPVPGDMKEFFAADANVCQQAIVELPQPVQVMTDLTLMLDPLDLSAD